VFDRIPWLLTVIAMTFVTAAPVWGQTVDYARLRSVEAQTEAMALNAVTRDLCGQTVVLLGENGFHGDGRTAAFKADLVQHLISDCGFGAVMFEASRYDFIALSRAIRHGDEASDAMLSSAIGGLWNQNEEIQDLIPFLLDQAKAGGVTLGGLDDQLGSRGAFYSLEQMPIELAGYLPEPRREDCAGRIRQRIWSAFPRDEPYSDPARSEIRQCLADISLAVATAPGTDARDRVDLQAMMISFAQALDRDFLDPPQRIRGRDHDMFQNLQAFMADLPSGTKVIIWSANSHVARDARVITPFQTGGNLGDYVHRHYSDRAFALGFSAASGSYRYTVRTAREIPSAAPGSLEAIALADTDVDISYLSPQELAALPAMPGSAFDDHLPVIADWGQIYDGLVIFRTERPPRRLDD
jgi:erythromycin esterase-like protein